MRLPFGKKTNIIIIAVVVIIAGFFLFYKFGILKYYDLLDQKNELKQKIEDINTENRKLRAEIDSLRNSDAKIEKVAREKYYMLRKGEKAFKVEEK